MVKCETVVNHQFQQEIEEISSQESRSSASNQAQTQVQVQKPSFLTLSNEIALSPIENKTWILSEEDSTVSFESAEGNLLEDVHFVHELPQADEERLEKLFNTLDRDGNGKIDVHDLSAALKEFGLSSQYAEVILDFFLGFLSLPRIYWIFQH